MRKNKDVAIDYNGLRVLVSTVASYTPVIGDKNSTSPTTHGIRFHLRTGETVSKLGTDITMRNDVLHFLDECFKPTHFTADLCQVCIYKKDYEKGACYSKHGCSSWNSSTGAFNGFVREEKDEHQSTSGG